ncbi:MAG TPA: hypothetical protein VGK17_17045 [Propionicimonas sp.]|jgi:hypothetical protein
MKICPKPVWGVLLVVAYMVVFCAVRVVSGVDYSPIGESVTTGLVLALILVLRERGRRIPLAGSGGRESHRRGNDELRRPDPKVP